MLEAEETDSMEDEEVPGVHDDHHPGESDDDDDDEADINMEEDGDKKKNGAVIRDDDNEDKDNNIHKKRKEHDNDDDDDADDVDDDEDEDEEDDDVQGAKACKNDAADPDAVDMDAESEESEQDEPDKEHDGADQENENEQEENEEEELEQEDGADEDAEAETDEEDFATEFSGSDCDDSAPGSDNEEGAEEAAAAEDDSEGLEGETEKRSTKRKTKAKSDAADPEDGDNHLAEGARILREIHQRARQSSRSTKLIWPTQLWRGQDILVINKPADWICSASDVDKRKGRTLDPNEKVSVKGFKEMEDLQSYRFGEREKKYIHWWIQLEHKLDAETYPNLFNEDENYGLCHRVDRETSGTLLIGLTKLARGQMRECFHRHYVRKLYVCLVHGIVTPREQTIDRQLEAMGQKARLHKNGKRARTHVKVLGTFTKEQRNGTHEYSLCTCEIAEGRMHQIRLHMASAIGCPIVSEIYYQDSRQMAEDRQWLHRIFLHAYAVGFPDVSGEHRRVGAGTTDEGTGLVAEEKKQDTEQEWHCCICPLTQELRESLSDLTPRDDKSRDLLDCVTTLGLLDENHESVHVMGTTLRQQHIDDAFFPWSSKVNPIEMGDLSKPRDSWDMGAFPFKPRNADSQQYGGKGQNRFNSQWYHKNDGGKRFGGGGGYNGYQGRGRGIGPPPPPRRSRSAGRGGGSGSSQEASTRQAQNLRLRGRGRSKSQHNASRRYQERNQDGGKRIRAGTGGTYNGYHERGHGVGPPPPPRRSRSAGRDGSGSGGEEGSSRQGPNLRLRGRGRSKSPHNASRRLSQ